MGPTSVSETTQGAKANVILVRCRAKPATVLVMEFAGSGHLQNPVLFIGVYRA